MAETGDSLFPPVQNDLALPAPRNRKVLVSRIKN